MNGGHRDSGLACPHDTLKLIANPAGLATPKRIPLAAVYESAGRHNGVQCVSFTQ